MPLDVPMHLLVAHRGFPLSRPPLAANWARISRVDVTEHGFDTHHALLPKPPYAQEIAACLDRILAGDLTATRIHPAACDAAEITLINRIKSLSRKGQFSEASALLEGGAGGATLDSAPDWMARGLIQLAWHTQDEVRLVALRHELAAQTPSPPTVLHDLLKQAGAAWLPLLRQAHEPPARR